jgi:MinD-like ATPase involved in chromosome partitioning or flagellar assembly
VLSERIGVLLAAGGAGWEVEALQAVGSASSGAVLLKRCIDLPDLLATAATGQARVALVSTVLDGLDADSITHLRSAGVGVVLVTDRPAGQGVPELPGVADVVDAADMGALLPALRAVAADVVAEEREGPGRSAGPAAAPGDEEVDAAAPHEHDAKGRVVAVWGPTGAPGRTTLAVGTAAELARRGHDVLLVDADGYGGAVAQHLGVLDEVSGLLSAVRLANAGNLDVARLASVARSVSPGFRVLTGLPRADRWVEVRPVAFDALLETARRLCTNVVLDLGFNLEQTEQAFGSSGAQRNQMTVAGIDQADELLVVGAADPVGLARLARGLVELREVSPPATTRIVVNRVRSTLGWGEREVRAMVEGFVTPASMHFLPDDPAAADRALMAGRPLVDLGDSSLRSALARVVDTLEEGDLAVPAPQGGGWLRRRRAGRAR